MEVLTCEIIRGEAVAFVQEEEELPSKYLNQKYC
jgi:hypothetical protein